VISPDPTDRILPQGKALVRGIEVLGAIQPTGRSERALAHLLMAAHRRRLRGLHSFDFCPEWQYTMCM
jgi:hypothetical protein